MVRVDELTDLPEQKTTGYRLVNSKFPPIGLFDDVADAEELNAVYACQALTNPRLQNEVGNLNLLASQDIPFGITGVSYAVAPFTHVNPDGSRFSSGDAGVLYIADNTVTALAEVQYHQQQYWSKIDGLAYDRFVFRELCCEFTTLGYKTLERNAHSADLLDPDDYTHAQSFGGALRQAGVAGLRYPSVRKHGQYCYALFSPKTVTRVVQAGHYEMVLRDGRLWTNRLMTPGQE
ncbi:RES family NAD+ phosphorylase [Alteromonas halophila]|uniref:RES domain-containing protein n=1 Tax=Alteromonas halophila TaxID=516698 RepID=A0A918MXD2_9ALTE|nr:RES family NAD+ phosphorylase [Alteromonas halophila]GGW82194.1 hypothetical protein GCM10007391_14000 [Alteromonas halophila]